MAPAPAWLVGVALERAAGLAPSRWGAQLVFGALALALGVAARRAAELTTQRALAMAFAAPLGMLLTLVAPGVDGVHRWVSLGPVALHPGALLLPAQLLALDRLALGGRTLRAAVAAGATLCVLVAQPDAGTATAYAAALTAIVGARTGGAPSGVFALVALAAVAGAWARPDRLAAVPEVEGVVRMAFGRGAGWGLTALGALAALVTTLAVHATRGTARERPTRQALALWTAGLLAASATERFPVPALGWGLSPLVGLCVALGLLGRAAPTTTAAPTAPDP
ncbi:MAG: hypothetical protein HY909_29005 [Deltaproteobacteria bacterium]|nr:hypothetical protein [Deltaproteobacteria bacterium]